MPRRKNPLSEFARGMDKMSRQMSDRLPPRERVDSKKRKKVIMGIYIGFEYQIQVSKNFNEIKIKRLSHHFE